MKQVLFFEKSNVSDKIFCRICETGFVAKTSRANMRRHYNKFHKIELTNFERSDSLVTFDSNVMSSNIEQIEGNSIGSQQNDLSDVKEILKGFEGEGKLTFRNFTMEFKGKFA